MSKLYTLIKSELCRTNLFAFQTDILRALASRAVWQLLNQKNMESIYGIIGNAKSIAVGIGLEIF